MQLKTSLSDVVQKNVPHESKSIQSTSSKKIHPFVPEPLSPLIDQDFPVQIFWTNVILCAAVHTLSLYGLYLLLTGQVMWQTFLWNTFLYFFVGTGITAGAHRYWSHKSYKAKTPLRILLATMQTFSFQYSIYDWSRTHRVHHKYSETNADPHNVKRGFFFAHLGWLLVREHPAVTQKLEELDSSDLESDQIVMFQKRYYWELVAICIAIIPTVCVYCWGETVEAAIFHALFLGFSFNLHMTGFINSAAHLWGIKPYDRNIGPTDNVLMIILTGGEGHHNYHHTFPWDYRSDEFGHTRFFITAFINMMAWIGWAYDLKTVSKDIVTARVRRTGDGSRNVNSN